MKYKTNRILLFIVALFVVALGVSFSTRANLGTSPAACPPYVLSLVPNSPLTMGTYMFIMQSFFLFLQVVLLRRQFQPFQLFQLAASFLFGFYTDLTMWMTTPFQTPIYVLRWLQLLIGCALVGIGVVMELKSALLMLPGEGIVQAISFVSGWPFSKIKIINDVVLTLTGVVLSYLLIGSLEGVREGTVASAFLVGIMIRFFVKPMSFLDSWVVVSQSVSLEKQVTSNLIITIAREHCSGGSEIAHLLAERLGVKCYGRDIIVESAQKLGISEKQVSNVEQKMSLEHLMEMIVATPTFPIKGLSPDDAVFVTESHIIRQMALREPCVIIGRLADYILRDNPNLFRIFIYSSEQKEARFAAKEKKLDIDEALHLVREKNASRALHYKYYTHQTWGNSRHYDLVINTENINTKQAVEMIMCVVKGIKRYAAV